MKDIKEWQLAEAKNKFSEVVSRALTDGPQKVRRRGDTVFVISAQEYDRVKADKKKNKKNFLEFLMSGPGLDDLDLTRNPSPMRDVEL